MDNMKFCPRENCDVLIEKSGGCNLITCPACMLEWCWVCREPWPCPGGNHAGVRECINAPAFDAAPMALTVQAPPSSSRVATPLAATPRQQQQQQQPLSIVQNVLRAVVTVGERIAGAVVVFCDGVVNFFNWIASELLKAVGLTKEDVASPSGSSTKGPQGRRAGPLQLEA